MLVGFLSCPTEAQLSVVEPLNSEQQSGVQPAPASG